MTESVKLYSIGILFFMSVISSIVIPFALVKIISRKRLISSDTFKKVIGALNCFSAGVFISTALVILLPEAQEMMETALRLMNKDIEFPVTEALAGIGFLLILLVENLVEVCYNRRMKNRKEEDHSNDLPESTPASLGNGHVQVISMNEISPNLDENKATSDAVPDVNHAHKDPRAVQNITLLLALTIHMVFDGLGIGLLDSPNKIWSMLLAVTLHKVLIFFSLGLHAIESTTKCRFIAAMVYISAVSPVGVGIGILLSSSEKDNVVIVTVSGVLQSIAAGTFIYVSFFEILMHEMSTSNLKLSNTLCVITGFCIFAGIVYVNP